MLVQLYAKSDSAMQEISMWIYHIYMYNFFLRQSVQNKFVSLMTKGTRIFIPNKKKSKLPSIMTMILDCIPDTSHLELTIGSVVPVEQSSEEDVFLRCGTIWLRISDRKGA